MGNFYTEVIQRSTLFASPKRCADVTMLEPATRAAVAGIIAQAKANGIDLMVWETYRSTARQELLFTQGATRLRTVGVHHYGLACDIVKCLDGEPSWKGDFTFLMPLAQSNGLISGIDWGLPDVKHDFIDSDHVQRCSRKRQRALFFGLWYPDITYNPYKDL